MQLLDRMSRQARRPVEEERPEVTIHVVEHEGEIYVRLDTVMDAMRAMMQGGAAPTFCDRFELWLRAAAEQAMRIARDLGRSSL